MIRQLYFSALIFILSNSLTAQTNGKVKGNKVVTSIRTDVNPFHTLSIDNDFNVEIIYNQIPSVTIETDENLHDVIKFHVADSILTFYKTAKITSKKQLKITINYDASLKTIEATDKAEILSLTTMELPNAQVIANGSSKVGLTIKSNQFEFQGKEKSKVKLNITSENAVFTLTDASKLEALVNAPKTKVDLYLRASATIEGKTDDFALRTDNNTNFDGKNFTIKHCNTLNETSSTAHLEVLETIAIDASGSSNIYLYGNPKITINKFENTAKLQKKEK